ncbi:bifunctional lysylphosphatidylglycerol flippase/synthetase MprF [Zavarzinia compransoris]|uniref:Phosphatidylglycerol lysyltransferase n=1 Tax=Zavarzinia compransoris TaxID=1264899 RepID=A0A317E6C9_9PROT|nr:bifunctional lysylphosphatidylglycerol flippase/synthetase MprF [Zavarzinia compransoris]PWR22172.1 bifunctional lysylphosphatidylglycerol flippase/synthetase MprF [Zavarzinia compransoris]TDP47075.1 phosphatidylglycerol lysyltransferase [Zavarzinia compransoris]
MKVLVTGVITVAVAALAWVALSHLAAEISYDDVSAALRSASPGTLAAALGCTAASFLALTLYDGTALAYVGRRIPPAVVGVASFCAYAVGNTVGFGPLTAGAIRYRFYTPHGLEPEDVAKVVGFVTATFGLGLLATTGLGLVVAGAAPGLDLPAGLLRPAGLLLLAVPAVLLVLAARGARLKLRGLVLALPRPRLLLVQYAATVADIAAAGSVLYILLPPVDTGWTGFIAVYAVAIGLGVLSHVPAGLGVFETVIVALVGPAADTGQVLGALLLYRVIYHVVPLLLAAVLVAAIEARRAALKLAASGLFGTGRWLVPTVLGALTLVLGGMLVFSGVTPAVDGNLDLLAAYLPLPIVEGAHFLSSVLGLLLMIAARGLVYRLDGAWLLAAVLAPAAMVLSLVKGIALVEAGLLGLLFLLLLATRAAFDRPASLIHQALGARWLIAVAVLLVTALAVLLFVYKDIDYAHELWWQFEFSAEAPRGLRALLGLALAAGAVAAWSLLRPFAPRAAPASAADLARARAIVEAQPRTQGQLALMGDKSLMFSDDGKAFIMYGRQGRSWIAMGDPVGARPSWPGLIWRFVEAARFAGGRAAFYQVAPENLALYADAGLNAFKLGEEAMVELAGFDIKGSKRANLRHAYNRAEREGLGFALLPAAEVPDHLPLLRRISDQWLAAHEVREKRFSLGAFDPAYLALQPVAILTRNGEPVAFASLMMTGQKDEASVDLMRFTPDAPPGSMDYLFLRLLFHFKDQGYRRFSLGMAPLSGLSESSAASLWHRVGRAVFDHGDRFYNFAGLHHFKAKFQPVWEARYLAVAGGINPMLALTDVTVLISGGWRGVVAK